MNDFETTYCKIAELIWTDRELASALLSQALQSEDALQYSPLAARMLEYGDNPDEHGRHFWSEIARLDACEDDFEELMFTRGGLTWWFWDITGEPLITSQVAYNNVQPSHLKGRIFKTERKDG